MYSILRIEGDPTSWTLSTPIAQVWEVTASTVPVALPVSAPLAGRLLLSPRSVGSVVFLEPPDDAGHIPSDSKQPVACLYVPSVTGPDSSPPRCYSLPASVNLANLEAEITLAMTGASFVTVDITGPADTGVVALNGAEVSFVVLCPGTTP